MQATIRAKVRATAMISAEPGPSPAVTVRLKDQKDDYRVESFSFESEPGIERSGLIATPARPGAHPAVLWMDSAPMERIAAAPDFVRLAASGSVVDAFQPRGVLTQIPPDKASMFSLGAYMGISLRAVVVGKTITGMRTDDAIRAMNWLSSRADVDRASITVYGRGALGMVALHAAALDPVITRVVTEGTLASYRMALDSPLHRNLSELSIHGILRQHDVSELLVAISPTSVTLVNPAGPLGQPARNPW